MKKEHHRYIASLLAVIILFCIISGCGQPIAVNAAAHSNGDDNSMVLMETGKISKPHLNYTRITAPTGVSLKLQMQNLTGKRKIIWRSSNKKCAIVSGKGVVKTRKPGKTTITAAIGKKKYICRVTCLGEKKYISAWCKQWKKSFIPAGMSDYDKVLTASLFVERYITYGKAKSAAYVIWSGKGTCVSGGRLLVELLKSMGFSARLRFAANDDMSRYPTGMIFAKKHHNVLVKIKGKNYFVDGTPEGGHGNIYLCTSKKPIYFALDYGDSLNIMIDEVPGH